MSDEEIRMRCLELIKDDINFGTAETLYKWVIKDRYPTKTPDKIHFEKINPERKD